MENGHMDHYFPQWLMRNWCDENNEIWCFDKRSQRIKKKGTAFFGRERDLNKSNILKLDLEATLFNEIDSKYGMLTIPTLLRAYFDKRTRIPNDLMRFFVELCLWTSIRNKRVQGWTDIETFRAGVAPDNVLHAFTDHELKKALHLHFLQSCKDGVMASEVDRLIKEFYFFFALSDSKFITSDMPVQEFGSDGAEAWLDCAPIDDGVCSLILFPITPEVMFVATRHQEFAELHRYFSEDEDLTFAN